VKLRETLPKNDPNIPPLPTAEQFGRPGAKLKEQEEKEIESSEDSSKKSISWSEKTVNNLKENFGYDPTEAPKVKERRMGREFGPNPPTVSKVTSNAQKYTFIAAYGANEDVSLTFRVPRELMEPKLEDAIGVGLDQILKSLMSMLTFAPLHGGIMENILRPPPQNPMMGPPGFPGPGQ